MKKTIILALIVLSGLLHFGAVYAEDRSQPSLLLNYWFYEGYLRQDLLASPSYVIPEQPVAVYEQAADSAPVVGMLTPGEKTRLVAIAYTMDPSGRPFIIDKCLASPDTDVVLGPGDAVVYVSRYGSDAVAVAYHQQILAVYAPDISLPVEMARDFGTKRQWLKVRTEQGLTGWCKFAPEDGGPLRGRWRIQPNAAGGSADFNTIVFSDSRPTFQRLPVLFAKDALKTN